MLNTTCLNQFDCRLKFFCVFSDQRETLIMQIPKGNDPRKKGWKDVVSAPSHTNEFLFYFDLLTFMLN